MNNEHKEHESTDLPKTARRELLGSGMAATAAALVGLVAACGDDEGAEMPGGSGGAGKGGKGGSGGNAGTGGSGGDGGKGGAAGDASVEPAADIEPLNALLTAEYNAITAYSAGAGLITGADAGDPLYALRQVIVDIAVDFQSQHKLHAVALVEAIEELGGEPVVEADVAADFAPPQALVDNPTISNVLKFAASAERGAAVAYNQVLAGLEAAKYRFLASAIEGDESQHFIVLAALVLGLAAPGPNLSSARAGDVVPEAFAATVGDENGLNDAPADYFA